MSVTVNLLCFGLNHRTAPIELLEQMSFDAVRMNAFISKLRESEWISEAFGISTCNRTEFYCIASQPSAVLHLMVSLLTDFCDVDLKVQADHTYFKQEKEAVRHLFRVASGLDSLIIGETEIAGQIRRTRETALKNGHIGPLLNDIVLQALEVSSRVRSETGISRGNISVASVAFSVAKNYFESMNGLTALVLGAGETAETAARYLRDRGIGDLIIANRTLEKAEKLAQSVSARVAGLPEVARLITEADIIVCATGSPEYVITADMIRRAVDARPHKQVLFLDISVPRNVEPLSIPIPGAVVITIDSLTRIAAENRAERESYVIQAQNLIDHETENFMENMVNHHAQYLISEIYRKAEELRQEHLEKFSGYFDESHREHLDMFTAGLVRKLFHEMTANIRALDPEDPEGLTQLLALEKIFNLSPAEVLAADDNI